MALRASATFKARAHGDDRTGLTSSDRAYLEVASSAVETFAVGWCQVPLLRAAGATILTYLLAPPRPPKLRRASD